jgi:hypothetical protein
LSVCEFIDKFITDRLIYRPEIADKSLLNGLVPFINPLLKYVPVDYELDINNNFHG